MFSFFITFFSSFPTINIVRVFLNLSGIRRMATIYLIIWIEFNYLNWALSVSGRMKFCTINLLGWQISAHDCFSFLITFFSFFFFDRNEKVQTNNSNENRSSRNNFSNCHHAIKISVSLKEIKESNILNTI